MDSTFFIHKKNVCSAWNYNEIALSAQVEVREAKFDPLVLANNKFWATLHQNVLSKKENVEYRFWNRPKYSFYYKYMEQNDLMNYKCANYVRNIVL